MEAVLQDLMTQSGMQAVILIDGAGRLIAHQGNPIYDRQLLEGVSVYVGRGADSIELVHADWEAMQATFADGLLMIRNLGAFPRYEGRLVLAAVADLSLNQSFANVAMRVTVQKLRGQLTTPAAPAPLGPITPGPTTPANATPRAVVTPVGGWDGGHSLRELGSSEAIPLTGEVGHASTVASGLSWSGLGASSSSVGVAVADDEGVRRLDGLTRALARFVGPMAKVFVKEAVREVCQGEPFAVERTEEVARQLSLRIEKPSGRGEFLSRVAELGGR